MLKVASICGVSLPSTVHIKSKIKKNTPYTVCPEKLRSSYPLGSSFHYLFVIYLMLVVLPFALEHFGENKLVWIHVL